MAKRALVSVSDKTGLVDFVRGLQAAGWEIIATGGTQHLLEENGVSREEVVKVNIWATSSSYNNEITKAYSEYFKDIRPCCTWIGIKELNRPSQLVEIEMQAIIGAKY